MRNGYRERLRAAASDAKANPELAKARKPFWGIQSATRWNEPMRGQICWINAER